MLAWLSVGAGCSRDAHIGHKLDAAKLSLELRQHWRHWASSNLVMPEAALDLEAAARSGNRSEPTRLT
eukprot:3917015-Karenia_brevis.AAC.1